MLLLGGMLLSGEFRVSRSRVVSAPPNKVYALVAEPRRWAECSVWARRVVCELFFPDFGTTMKGELVFAAEAGGTRVTRVMNGYKGHSPLFRWMALFSDKLAGKDFERGLAGHKALAEKP